MKKSLLVIAMSLVMGGLVISPNDTTIAKAEEKLLRPDQAITNAPHAPYFEAEGNLRYPWELLTGKYNGVGPKVEDIATMDIAFFPTDTGFIEGEEYAVINQENAGVLSSSKIINALKDAWAEPNIDYSPAFRYVSKIPDEYADSDWYVMNDISYNYEFDYSLNIYGNLSVNTEGRLVWAWEIFTSNAQAAEIDHMEVLVFSGSTTAIDDDAKPLTTFIVDYNAGDRFTYKADIERYLTLANLKKGEYRFSARLIPVEGSKFEKSHLYPLTGAFTYEPEDLELANVAKGCPSYASSGAAKEAFDGNYNSRWIQTDKDESAWLMVDLGTVYFLSAVNVYWEGAYAKDYDVFLAKNIIPESFDGDTSKMTPIASVRNRTEYNYLDEFEVSNVSGRYLIVSCITRGAGYPYSIWEVEAFVDTTLSEAEKFIHDWKDLRALGNGDICGLVETEEMARLLSWYDRLPSEDKRIVDETLDAQGNTIGSSVAYFKELLSSRENTNGNNNSTSGLLLTFAKENKYTIAIVIGLIALTFVGYFSLNKKKKLVK
ncbi:MAG: discoidin domain-containing protein [Erysipelotrichales bacterium]|nr:discoidin domain-containing protein [Erysipelotrichales bacterium]